MEPTSRHSLGAGLLTLTLAVLIVLLVASSAASPPDPQHRAGLQASNRAATGRSRSGPWGMGATVQTTRPRDLGVLVLVVGLLLSLLVITILLGSPAIR